MKRLSFHLWSGRHLKDCEQKVSIYLPDPVFVPLALIQEAVVIPSKSGTAVLYWAAPQRPINKQRADSRAGQRRTNNGQIWIETHGVARARQRRSRCMTPQVFTGQKVKSPSQPDVTGVLSQSDRIRVRASPGPGRAGKDLFIGLWVAVYAIDMLMVCQHWVSYLFAYIHIYVCKIYAKVFVENLLTRGEK